MIIPMLCVTIFVILVVWFLLPRVARLMIHTPTAISIFVCLSMVQLMAVDRKSGSAGMPRPISYAVFCLKKKKEEENAAVEQVPKSTHLLGHALLDDNKVLGSEPCEAVLLVKHLGETL